MSFQIHATFWGSPMSADVEVARGWEKFEENVEKTLASWCTGVLTVVHGCARRIVIGRTIIFPSISA